MRVRKKLGVCYVLMVLLTIAIVIPIIWLVFISMKPNSEIMNNPLSLPNALDFGNYVSALQTLDLFTLYKNTAFIAVCSLAVEIVITFSSAVGLTRLYYRSDGVRSGLQGFLQLGLAVSPFILLFPIYKINKFLGFSQQLSLILPYIATSISFNTLLFTAYLRTVPKELDEAALMDGVSLWQLMTKILVPIAKPVLATVIIEAFVVWDFVRFQKTMKLLESMEKAAEMLGILKELAEKGSVMAVSDVGVGVQFARTAILGAVMNVYINTRSMKDRKRAEELNREAKRLTKEGTDAADRIYEKIVKQLQG